MNKDQLQRYIAESAYNVGFGAKKHFATYDIAEKAPGLISFISMAIGIFALYISQLEAKALSASLIVMGIVGLYISFWDGTKVTYANKGEELTQLYNQLKALYFKVKNSEAHEFPEELAELKSIEQRFYSVSDPRQMLFSDWYAHYKFFWQHQIGWVDEELSFSIWRDKIPLSFLFVVALLIVTVRCLLILRMQ